MARYDLRLTDAEFYTMTPRQIVLLMDRHRLELVHRELTAAYTTSAVINFSQLRPEDGVKVSDFMPNHRNRHQPQSWETMTDEELEAASRLSVLIAEEAQRQREAQYG